MPDVFGQNEKTLLKTHIESSVDPGVVAALAIEDWQTLADIYNQEVNPPVVLFRHDVTEQEFFDAIVWSELFFSKGTYQNTNDLLNGILDGHVQRSRIDVLRMRLQAGGEGPPGASLWDFRRQNDFDLFKAVFPAGSVTRSNLSVIGVVNATLGQSVFIYDVVGSISRSSYMELLTANDVRSAIREG